MPHQNGIINEELRACVAHCECPIVHLLLLSNVHPRVVDRMRYVHLIDVQQCVWLVIFLQYVDESSLSGVSLCVDLHGHAISSLNKENSADNFRDSFIVSGFPVRSVLPVDVTAFGSTSAPHSSKLSAFAFGDTILARLLVNRAGPIVH